VAGHDHGRAGDQVKDLFPRSTATWPATGASPFRAGTRSVVLMAAVTGVVLRLYRAAVLTYGSDASWLVVGAALVVGAVVLFGMATLHLSNYPVRRWPLRAAAFALVEVAAELLTSVALIALGLERRGTSLATMDDWREIASITASVRVGALALFVLVLAGVVQAVRITLGRRDTRMDDVEG
jgi:hypothetical protein